MPLLPLRHIQVMCNMLVLTSAGRVPSQITQKPVDATATSRPDFKCSRQCDVPEGNVNNFPENSYLHSDCQDTEDDAGSHVDDTVTVSDSEAVSNSDVTTEKGAQCERHPDHEVDLYCRICSLFACSECVREKHRNHNVCGHMLVDSQYDRDSIFKITAKRIASDLKTEAQVEDIDRVTEVEIQSMPSLFHERKEVLNTRATNEAWANISSYQGQSTIRKGIIKPKPNHQRLDKQNIFPKAVDENFVNSPKDNQYPYRCNVDIPDKGGPSSYENNIDMIYSDNIHHVKCRPMYMCTWNIHIHKYL